MITLYDVKIVFDVDERDYMIRNIKADDENAAIEIAKNFVANCGYFPGMSTDKIKKHLFVKKIETTEIDSDD